MNALLITKNIIKNKEKHIISHWHIKTFAKEYVNAFMKRRYFVTLVFIIRPGVVILYHVFVVLYSDLAANKPQ